MNRLFVVIFSAVVAVSLAFTPVVFADAGAGEKVFNDAKRCSKCHKADGDPAQYKPVGPGLKGVGALTGKEFLLKWLSPGITALFEANDPTLEKVKAKYKAAKAKDLDLKGSQMAKMMGGDKPKIPLTDQERADLVDYLMSL